MVNIHEQCALLKQNKSAAISFEVQTISCNELLQLSSSLKGNTSLHTLSFDKCTLDNQSLAALFLRLNIENKLQNLSISGCYITQPTFEVLLNFIRNAKQLRTLDLSDLQLSDAQGQALAHALIENNSIEITNLECNQFGTQAAVGFAELLTSTDCLKELNLSSNHFNQQDLDLLVEALAKNTSVTSLNLLFNLQSYTETFGLSVLDQQLDKTIKNQIEENQIRKFLIHLCTHSVEQSDLAFWASKVKVGGKNHQGFQLPHTIHSLLKHATPVTPCSSEQLATQLTQPSHSWSAFFGRSKKYRSTAVQKLRDQQIEFAMDTKKGL